MGSTISGGTQISIVSGALTTWQDILELALTEINAITPGDTVSSTDIELARKYYNLLVDQWNARSIICYVINHNSYPWATSKQSYTIGPTGDFVASRPVKIERANLILVGTEDVRVPLDVINFEKYANIPIPELTSTYPVKLYYQPTDPNGTLWPWPYPTDTTNSLELFTRNQLAEISTADLSTYVSFPPGYRMALVSNLAINLCTPYEKEASDALREKARQALAIIVNANAEPRYQVNDFTTPKFTSGGMQWNPAIRGWS